MNKFLVATKYIQHQLKAFNRHGIHSPFVYDFLEKVVYADQSNSHFKKFTRLRAKLKKDTRSILITDLGAGSTINKSNTRSVKDIAHNSSKAPKYGRLFYRMVQYFNPASVVELGTSLGLSTIYFASANPNTPIYTLEGCPNTAKIASENFIDLGIDNVILELGDFSVTLPELLGQTKNVDLVFFDGNHQKEPTLAYFEECLKYATNRSIFIFDDIHWSEGMTETWEKIKGHSKTVVTLDLFFVGIVFFDTRLSQQDFKIRF